jgi:hypothetical protein
MSSTVQLATVTTAARGFYSSTYATLRFMLRPLTVMTVIDLSIANRRCNSTYEIHQRISCRIHQQDTETPLDVFFRSLIMALLSHQLLHMPTCGNTKDGAMAVPRQAMRGTDTKMRCKTNCTCDTVQRTI